MKIQLFSSRVFRVFGYALLCTMASVSHAAMQSGWWGSIEGGYDFSRSDNNTITKTMPEVSLPDQYKTTDLDNRAIAGIGFGYQFILQQPAVYKGQYKGQLTEGYTWFPANRVGLMYDYYFNGDVSGYINKWSTVKTYDFSYVTHSNTFWLVDQLDILKYKNVVTFIELGFGDAINATESYKENAVSGVPSQDIREDADFKSRNYNEFAWRLGVGVNVLLPNHFALGVLYRYSDLGKAKTGTSETIPGIQGGLHERIRGNEVLATLRYDIGG